MNIYMIRDHVDLCVGVDIVDLLADKNKIIFNKMSTDDFFANNTENFDIVFIDADHRWYHVRRDFENSLKFLNEYGIIIFHDTDPIERKLTHDDFCSNSYIIHDYVYANHPELNIMTFPVNEMGLTFIMRKKDRRVNKVL